MVDIPLGIDLGTHNTRAAGIQSGNPVVIPDGEGNPVHPSVVGFTPEGVRVGQAARRLLATSPRTTVHGLKRLLGRQFFSEEVKRARSTFPMDIVEGPDHSVRVVVNDHAYEVAEILALLVKDIRSLAETHLGAEVRRAVLTVPSRFNDRQRESTADVARRAGLEVMDIIDETTAAALAYGLGGKNEQKVAVFDLGGDECTIYVMELGPGGRRELATASDPHMGGDDFDDRILGWMLESIQQSHDVDLSGVPPAMALLRAAAEDAKNQLSATDTAEIRVRAVPRSQDGDTVDVSLSLPRMQFDRMVLDMLQRAFKVCDEALRTAGLTAHNLDEVVLVGGPTRLPVIQTGIKRYFQRAPLSAIDPNVVLAIGAARHAEASRNAPPRPIPASIPLEEVAPAPVEEPAPISAESAGLQLEEAPAVTPAAPAVAPVAAEVLAIVERLQGQKAELEELERRWEAVRAQAQGADALAQSLTLLQEQMGSVQQLLSGVQSQLADAQAQQQQASTAGAQLSEAITASSATVEKLEAAAARAQVLEEKERTLDERLERLAAMEARLQEREDRLLALEARLQEPPRAPTGEEGRRYQDDMEELRRWHAQVTEELVDLHIRHDELRDKDVLLDRVQSRLEEVARAADGMGADGAAETRRRLEELGEQVTELRRSVQGLQGGADAGVPTGHEVGEA